MLLVKRKTMKGWKRTIRNQDYTINNIENKSLLQQAG